jgi:hypothetical protein
MHRLTSVVLGFLSAGWLSGEVPGARMVPQLPLRFEPAAAGGFVARGAGFTVDIRAKENSLLWSSARSEFSVRTRFPGAREDARVEGIGPLGSRSNYFVGNSEESA